jgi:acetyltransferase-like isoleucine patch superfamily enzyme
MTTLDRLFSYFPLLLTAASFAAFGVFARHPSAWSALLLIAVLYLLPPLILRILMRWTPIDEGVSLIGKTFSPWLASHNIQAFYDALPYLEALLRVLPGFYSMWLRLWGSRVGYGVEWAVNVAVLDRNLMDIGNRVVFSRQVEMAAHVRRKMEGGGSRVLVRHVRIGSSAFLGAGVTVSAGAVVPANAQAPALKVIGVNETLGEGVHHPRPDEAEFAVT